MYIFGCPPRQQVAVEHQRLKANCRKVEEIPEERNDSGRSYRRRCAFIPPQDSKLALHSLLNPMVRTTLSNTFLVCFEFRLLDLDNELGRDHVDMS